MLQEIDLAEIALKVAREGRLMVLDLLNQKQPAPLYDPLLLTRFETRLRDFIFEELCDRFLKSEKQEDFLARMSFELQRQQSSASTSVDWEALEQAMKEHDDG